jgi:arylsulfatase A-like enzyme
MAQSEACDRRTFLARAAAAAVVVGLGPRAARAAEHPNFLVVLTDDQRWDTLGCCGNAIIQTPNLDRLAGEGVRFTNHFCTTSICCSSRANMLTGMHTRRTGVRDFSTPLPAELQALTYPVQLRRAGYRTGYVGKWNIGGPLPKDDYDFYTGFGGQGDYFPDKANPTRHLTRILTGQGLDFLAGCTREQPFCLVFSTKAPHVQDGHPDPFRYDPRLAERYADVRMPVPPTANEQSYQNLPDFLHDTEGRVRWKTRFSTPELFQHSVKGYYRLITGVDIAVGRLVDDLAQRGLLDHTVVAFTSDNGFFLGEHGLAGKWLMYEESIRVPLFIRDLRLPATRGTTCAATSLSIDLAPTLLDLAGVPIPERMQGRSLAPFLRGEQPPWREDWYYDHPFPHPRIPKSEGVRAARWEYLRYPEQQPVYEQLFDLATDPVEEHNLAGEPAQRERLESMRRRCDQLRAEAG